MEEENAPMHRAWETLNKKGEDFIVVQLQWVKRL